MFDLVQLWYYSRNIVECLDQSLDYLRNTVVVGFDQTRTLSL